MAFCKKTKVMVIGDFMYDKYIYGKTTKISSEASLPVFAKTSTEIKFGGAGNVAMNCSSHADVTFYTAFGKDVAQPKAPFAMVNLPGKTVTTIKERFIVKNENVFRCDEEKYEEINIDNIEVNGYDTIIISDYNKGCVHSPQKLIAKSKCPVFVDPKGTDWAKYTGAYCLMPNQEEFEQVCGSFNVDNARKAIEKYRLNAIVVTLSAQGVVWVTMSDIIHLPATTTAVDVIGAGDTFAAIFSCYFDENNIQKSLQIANAAAGIAVKKCGTYIVTKKDLEEILTKYCCDKDGSECLTTFKGTLNDNNNCIKENNKLEREEKKEAVVFTNGCFDIVHVGHLKFLQNARSLGDKLIVGLNSDASVTRIKRTPINSQQKRKELLKGFSFVDDVIIFDEDTPYNLIRRVKPDILVKGGDYKAEDIVGRDLVPHTVASPVFVSDISTTKVIQKCHEYMVTVDCKLKQLPSEYYKILDTHNREEENDCIVCENFKKVPCGQLVPKKWGCEHIIVSNEYYAGKILHFDRAGSRFSMHFHAIKRESWYVLSGSFKLTTINTVDASELVTELLVGDVLDIHPLEPHQLEAQQDHSVIFEVSTADHHTDNYRVRPGDNQK